MKRFLGIVLTILTVSVHVAYAQEIESLSVAPRSTASYLQTQLAKGAKVLLLTISAPAEVVAVADYLSGDLSTIMVNGKYFTMVDRSGITDAEMKYQLSGNVSDESAQSMGHQTGAEITVWGSIELLGTLYRLNIKAASVKTAEILAQRAVFLQNDQFLTSILNKRSEAAPAKPSWIDKPSPYGRLTFEGSATIDSSPWYYEVGMSTRMASEQLARNRAREDVQKAIVGNIASDMKARIDITEFVSFTASGIEDAERHIEAALTAQSGLGFPVTS